MKNKQSVVMFPIPQIVRIDGKIVYCPHVWLKNPEVKGQQLCSGCGAFCVRNEHKQIVEYDRNWNWGNPIPLDGEEVRPAQRRTREAA